MRHPTHFFLWSLITVSLTASLTSLADEPAAKLRPATWAVKLDRPGLANFYQVTANVYRGAQPTARGMAELKAMGVKTVLDLRAFHSDAGLVGGADLKLSRLGMEPWNPKDSDTIQFLKIVTDTNKLPVFVHCQRGADRTGTMIAIYRITACGWTKEEAIKEMREGGFSFSPAWKNLVNYIQHADIEKFRKEAGLITNKITGQQIVSGPRNNLP